MDSFGDGFVTHDIRAGTDTVSTNNIVGSDGKHTANEKHTVLTVDGCNHSSIARAVAMPGLIGGDPATVIFNTGTKGEHPKKAATVWYCVIVRAGFGFVLHPCGRRKIPKVLIRNNIQAVFFYILKLHNPPIKSAGDPVVGVRRFRSAIYIPPQDRRYRSASRALIGRRRQAAKMKMGFCLPSV